MLCLLGLYASSSSWNHFTISTQQLSPLSTHFRESLGGGAKALQSIAGPTALFCGPSFVLVYALKLKWSGGIHNSCSQVPSEHIRWVPCNSCEITMGEFSLLSCLLLYSGGVSVPRMALCLTIPRSVLPLNVPALLTLLNPAASYYFPFQVQYPGTKVNGRSLWLFGWAHPRVPHVLSIHRH